MKATRTGITFQGRPIVGRVFKVCAQSITDYTAGSLELGTIMTFHHSTLNTPNWNRWTVTDTENKVIETGFVTKREAEEFFLLELATRPS